MRQGEQTRTSIWSVTFVALTMVSFFQAMGQMMMNTLIPLYTYELGATAQVVGMVAGAFAVTALFLRPFVAPAFDAFNKKFILLVALVVITVATLLYSVADSVPAMFCTRLLHGAGMACSAPVALALVSDDLPPEKLNSGISIYGLSLAGAQCVGPAFGLWLLDLVGYTWTFRTAGIMMVVACVLVLLLKVPAQAERPRYRLRLSTMFTKGSLIPAGLACLLAIPFTCINSFIVIFGNLQGVEGMGYYFMVYALCLFATRPAFGNVADRIGPFKVIPVGLAFFAASLWLVSCADSLPSFLLAAVVGACGYGVVAPLLQALCLSCAPESMRGAASNTYFTGLDLGNLVGPTLGGTLVGAFCSMGASEAQGYASMYAAQVIVVAVAFVFFLVMRKALKRLSGMDGAAGPGEHKAG